MNPILYSEQQTVFNFKDAAKEDIIAPDFVDIDYLLYKGKYVFKKVQRIKYFANPTSC